MSNINLSWFSVAGVIAIGLCIYFGIELIRRSKEPNSTKIPQQQDAKESVRFSASGIFSEGPKEKSSTAVPVSTGATTERAHPGEGTQPTVVALPAETPVAETPTPAETAAVETQPIVVALPAETPVAETPTPAETQPIVVALPAETPVAETPTPAETAAVETQPIVVALPAETPVAETPTPVETPVAETPTPEVGELSDTKEAVAKVGWLTKTFGTGGKTSTTELNSEPESEVQARLTEMDGLNENLKQAEKMPEPVAETNGPGLLGPAIITAQDLEDEYAKHNKSSRGFLNRLRGGGKTDTNVSFQENLPEVKTGTSEIELALSQRVDHVKLGLPEAIPKREDIYT